MTWTIPGDPQSTGFDTYEAAVARAWELTAPGDKRPEPHKVTSAPPQAVDVINMSITPDDDYESVVRSFSGEILTSVRAPSQNYTISMRFRLPYGVPWEPLMEEAMKILTMEAERRGLQIIGGVNVETMEFAGPMDGPTLILSARTTLVTS